MYIFGVILYLKNLQVGQLATVDNPRIVVTILSQLLPKKGLSNNDVSLKTETVDVTKLSETKP